MVGLSRVVTALLMLALVTAAHANPAQPTDKEKQEARAHFKMGMAFYEAGAYARAIEEYTQSYALLPLPALLFDIAQAYRLSGETEKALHFYTRYLDDEPGGFAGDEARQHVAELTVALQSKVPAPIPAATLLVHATPPGVTATLDGHAVDLGKPIGNLPPGPHQLELSAPGHQSLHRTLTVTPGSTLEVELSLVALGKARVTTSRPAAVTIDGKEVGAAPAEAELDPGRHVIEASAPGYNPSRQEVEVASGQMRAVDLQLTVKRPPLYKRWVLWVPVAVVVVGAGVGVGVGLAVSGRHPFDATRPGFGAPALTVRY